MLFEYLKDNIQLRESVSNWEESIKIASLPLLEKNLIKKSYIKSMIDNINNLGFFVVLSDGLAMPHSRPENGVVENSLSLLKLNHPVKYGESDIKLIFILAAKNNNSHTDLLIELMELFQNERKMKSLFDANNIEKIKKIIKQ